MDFINTFIWDFDGSFNWLGAILLTMIVLVALFLLGAIIVWIISYIGFSLVKEQYIDGKIKNKYYTPEKFSSGVGVGMTGQGVGPVITSNYDSEEYTLEIHLNDGDIIRESVLSDFYDECEIGDKVKIGYKISKWTKDFSVISIEKCEKINKFSVCKKHTKVKGAIKQR